MNKNFNEILLDALFFFLFYIFKIEQITYTEQLLE